jgi:hypothetical protein
LMLQQAKQLAGRGTGQATADLATVREAKHAEGFRAVVSVLVRFVDASYLAQAVTTLGGGLVSRW